MASASSRIMSLKLVKEAVSPCLGRAVNICLVPANCSTCDLGLRIAVHTCKGLDLLSNNVDPSIIACIELEDHLPHVLITVNPPR